MKSRWNSRTLFGTLLFQSTLRNSNSDDTDISIELNNISKKFENANKELSNAAERMKVNRPSHKAQKIEFKIIGHQFRTRNVDLPEALALNGLDRQRVDKTKTLGVIIDKHGAVG